MKIIIMIIMMNIIMIKIIMILLNKMKGNQDAQLTPFDSRCPVSVTFSTRSQPLTVCLAPQYANCFWRCDDDWAAWIPVYVDTHRYINHGTARQEGNLSYPWQVRASYGLLGSCWIQVRFMGRLGSVQNPFVFGSRSVHVRFRIGSMFVSCLVQAWFLLDSCLVQDRFVFSSCLTQDQ